MKKASEILGLASLLLGTFLAATTARADQTIRYWIFPGEYPSINSVDSYQGTCHVAIGTDTKLPAGHYTVTLKAEDFHPTSGWTVLGYPGLGFDVNDKGSVIASETVSIGPSFGGSVSDWESAAAGNPGKTRWTAYFNGKVLRKLTTLTQSPDFVKLHVDYQDPPANHSGHFKEDFPVQPHAKPCEACSNGSCSAGDDTDPALHSLDYTISLGRNRLDDFSTANQLTITADTALPQLASPASLEINYANENGNETIFAPGGVPRQVVGPQTLADIVVLSPFKYQISLYPATAKGNKNPDTGLYVPTGSPSKVITIENPDNSATVYNRLHITESPSGGVGGQRDYLYVNTGADPAQHLNGQWELVSGWGQRHETLVSVPIDANNRSETRTITDPVGKIVSQVRRQYRMYTWGEEMVSETLDPNGAALTTTYDYWHVDDPNATNPPSDPYRNWANRLKTKVDPNGHWERYEYDNLDRPTKTTSQFLDVPLNAPDNQCRVTTTVYNDTPPLTETTVETLQGVEVSRRYQRYFAQGKAQEIVCQHPGAAIDAADNLVTTTVTDANGNVVSTLRPDGTLSTYSSSSTAAQKTELSATGAPSADGTTVVDGTLTATVSDAGGHQLLQMVQDISSGLLLSSATTSQADVFGRPMRVDYANGSSELTSYDCCGVSSRTDRDGITTSYAYDALRRLESETRAGVTMHYTYDAAGRRLSTVREGTDHSMITTGAVAYDVAGRQISHTDALGYITAYAETIDASGHTVRTTTLPDDEHSTRVETAAHDGSPLSVGGTAAHPLQYAYGVDATAGVWTQVIRVGSQGETTEWTKTYTDVAGRAYKTETAAGAVTQSFFNAQGQTIRAVDPDGVIVLYGYNARGEQDTVAIDMDRNSQIDFAGTDRITRTARTVVHAHDATVTRTTTSAWTTDGTDAPAVIAVDEQNTDGRESWQTDAGGLVTHTQTSCGGAGTCTTTVTAPDGSYTVGVAQAGQATSQTRYDADSQVLSGTTFDYDAQGRLWRQIDRRNGPTTYVLDNADRLRQISHAGQTTGYDYDALGRKKLQTEPDNGQIQTLYWPTGEVKALSGIRTYPQEYTYDAQGRLKTLTTHGAAGAATTTWNYNGQSGQMIGKLYADGKGPSYAYTLGGRLHTRTWARGIVTTYGYDNAGQLQTVSYSDNTTPAGGYAYDRLGRLVTASGGGSTRALAYQGNTSLLASETSTVGPLAGVAVNTGYDALLRRTSLSVTNNGTNLLTQGFGFDTASRLASASQGTASAAYAYWPGSASNLVRTITFKNNGAPVMTTAKTYEALDRLGSIVSTVQGATTPVAGYSYTYNAANERTRADVAADGSHWSYGYDGLGQVTAANRRWNGDDSPVAGQQFGYAYDAIGNRTSTATNGRPSIYASNALNQYSQRTVPGTVDVLGAAAPEATVTVDGQPAVRQQGSYFAGTASADNRQGAVDVPVNVTAVKQSTGAEGNALAVQQGSVFLPQTPERFSYDDDGNLTQDGHWTYVWDGENRLVGMEALGSLPPAERKKLAFGYDDVCRRVQKQVWNWNAATSAYEAGANTLFAYDGWNLAAELDGANGGAPLRSYLWGLDLSGSLQGAGGVGGLLAVTDHTDGGAQSHFACFDGNGNVAALVKAQDASISANYEYGTFGETARATGTMAQVNPVRWSSKYQDSESGLNYYGYRFYQVGMGKWLSRDPLEENAAVNLYGFCGNTQLNRIDRFGLSGVGLTAAGAALTDSAEVSAFASTLGTTSTAAGTAGAAGAAGGISATAATGIGAVVILAAGAVIEQTNPELADPFFDSFFHNAQPPIARPLDLSRLPGAGVLYGCPTFASAASDSLRRRKKKYTFIWYKKYSDQEVTPVDHRDEERKGVIYAEMGIFVGQRISTNGFHIGVLYDSMVYDNNVPRGVPILEWLEGYLVFDKCLYPIFIRQGESAGVGRVRTGLTPPLEAAGAF